MTVGLHVRHTHASLGDLFLSNTENYMLLSQNQRAHLVMINVDQFKNI